ncbi:MAG: poly-gamma-glutamate hydrolase family protein [Desulfobacterales bacterium]
MADKAKYQSFKMLAEKEAENVDYRIRWRQGTSEIAIMAIHGGGIEPGTTEIAEAIAGGHHSFYTFSGLKTSGNAVLHITSRRFDEPTGLSMAKNAATIITIHGCLEKGRFIYIGGRSTALKNKIATSLKQAGYQIDKSSRFPGLSPTNICNRCRYKAGVQLEIAYGLRIQMFKSLKRHQRDKTNEIFHRFVDAVKEIISPKKKVLFPPETLLVHI